MALSFTPKTEEQIAEENLVPDGEYPFEVIKAEEAISKKTGDPMIKLKLCIFTDDGPAGERHVYDYLIQTMDFKLRHFCACTGLLERYETGTLEAEDCNGRTGHCIVKTEKQAGYKPKNAVKDYVVPKQPEGSGNPSAAHQSLAKPLAVNVSRSADPKPVAPAAPVTDAAEDDVPF